MVVPLNDDEHVSLGILGGDEPRRLRGAAISRSSLTRKAYLLMYSSRRFGSFSATLTLLYLAVGCSASTGPARIEVFGTVSYKSQPVKDGEISFVSDGQKDVPSTSAPIKDGKYRVAPEVGVAAGTYRVEINAYQPSADQKQELAPGGLDRPPPPGGFRDQILPEIYNKQSTIPKLVVNSGDKKLEKNFDLKE